MAEIQRSKFEPWLKVLPALGAIGVFFWGVYTYKDTTALQLARDEREADKIQETRRVEATRPYLETQLKLYTEATKTAATIATSDNPDEVAKAKKRFFELYYGELALVERDRVANAMIAFKKALDAGKHEELSGLSLSLARACRDELAVSWGTDAWKR